MHFFPLTATFQLTSDGNSTLSHPPPGSMQLPKDLFYNDFIQTYVSRSMKKEKRQIQVSNSRRAVSGTQAQPLNREITEVRWKTRRNRSMQRKKDMSQENFL